jgi:hypothetical protein
MRALEVFAIYVTPFLILGAAARFLMKQHAVDLTDVRSQADPGWRARKVFLSGG